MKMRTIEQCAAYLKSMDPETALTKTAIRRMVVTGQIPSVRVGNKYLLEMETLERVLIGGFDKKSIHEHTNDYGRIRPVEV